MDERSHEYLAYLPFKHLIVMRISVLFVFQNPLKQHRGKTSAHAPNYENMAGNLNINF
jgi:hypothetical protein